MTLATSFKEEICIDCKNNCSIDEVNQKIRIVDIDKYGFSCECEYYDKVKE